MAARMGELHELNLSSSLSVEFHPTISEDLMVRLGRSNKAQEQGEPAVYSFYNPEVRRKLKKLINTDVIRIMDKNFMNNLQDKLLESYWADFEERLELRRKKEMERRTKLALKGVQQMYTKDLDDHPIMRIGRKVEEEMEIARKRSEKPPRKPRVDQWEYDQFVTPSELCSRSSEVSPLEEEIPDRDWLRASRRRYEAAVEEAVEIGQLPTQDILENLKYEPPLVKELRTLHTVEDLYSMAERIIGTAQTRGQTVVSEAPADAAEAGAAAEDLPAERATLPTAKSAAVGKKGKKPGKKDKKDDKKGKKGGKKKK